ncbi:N-acetylglucosamine-binding protein GbpA [Serratia sp. SM04]|uniref:N-acetylglucosamine-binding protein GbpA n=1 Tax=Serratia sp. SM04 TaxID=3162878 RepID=UPI0033147095
MKLSKIALMMATLAASSAAWSHGYIEVPESRAYKCKLGSNTDCGRAQWEPQSVEQVSGFPGGATPLDGQLASGGVNGFESLDRQGVNVWALNTMKPGPQTFTWYHTAKHKTNNWRYYITKQDWDVNKPLSREAFEKEPFCEIDGHAKPPKDREVHQCVVPERTGYQVIYGVWEINDTVNSFYQVVDVNFEDDGVVSEWRKQLQGSLTGKNLQVGDKVIARFFDADGEVLTMKTELAIDSETLTDKNRWGHALACKINAEQKAVRAGVKDGKGNVNPVFGNNAVYAKQGSTMKSVVISYEEETPAITEEIRIGNLSSTKIKDGKAQLTFNAEVKGKLTVEARVYDHGQTEKGYLKATLEDASQPLTMALSNVSEGHHMLKVIASNDNGQSIQPDIENFNLEAESTGGGGGNGDYNFVFPNALSKYTAGTTVLQPKDGKVYQCKPFPYSGYCMQWNSGATHFEPGVGSNWQDAWVVKK